MDLQSFAAERNSRIQSYDEELLPVVRAALKDWSADRAWYAPVVERAEELFYDASGSGATDAVLADLRETLAKTKDPGETAGDTADRLAKWVATYIVNAAEHSSSDADTVKTWITMHDDKVRSLHRLLDGKTIPSAEKFDVDGARLAYPGQPVGDPAGWINCRCILKTTKGDEMSLIAAADQSDVPAADGPEDENGPAVDEQVEVPFHGVATVTDTPTGDGRQLAGTGFSVRPLPLPLFYQRAQGDGHGGSTIVGQLTRVELNEAGEVEYDGHFNFTPEAGEAIQGVAEGWLKGVSVDLDDVIVDYSGMDAMQDEEDDRPLSEVMDELQREVTVMKEWRVAGLTMVGIPAFYQAFIKLGTRAEAEAADAQPTAADSLAASIVTPETFAPGTHDGPGWITDPVPTGRIRRYWTHGEGAAKIRWGEPGDFNRCRGQLAKYIENPDWLAGACANMHKEATGGWPGHAPTEGAALERQSLVAAGAQIAAAFNLVASVRTKDLPPAEWFENPQLTGPTPITIEGDHIYGHIATWGTCHIGMQGICTTAPRSETDYAWFRLGAVETDAGLVPVGSITMNTGHVDNPRASAAAAVAHYDNTGTAVADVAAGEDDYGIWFSGRIRSNATREEREALLAAKLSGDWRRVNGNLELVAALAVNTPGFGIPRVSLAASGAEQLSLVAAGLVEVHEPTLEEQIDARVTAVLARRDRLAGLPNRTARLRELVAQRRQARLDAARARLRKDVP